MTATAARSPRATSNPDSLDLYLDEVRRYPLLKGDEEIVLAQRARAGDEDAVNELVTRNLRFVVSVAKKYRGCGLPFMDLVSEGNIGLLTAARKFDPDRGVKFISYGVWWVRQAIHTALARQAHVVRLPVSRSADLSSLARARESLRQQFGREPSISEVAEFTGLAPREIESVSGFAADDVSLDAPVDHDGARELIEELIDERAPEPDEQVVNNGLAAQVQAAISSLPPREAMILRLHFGLDGEEARSLEAIGTSMGITRERVRQIHDRALRRLRTGIAGQSLSSFAA